jgi:hypothetical protein
MFSNVVCEQPKLVHLLQSLIAGEAENGSGAPLGPATAEHSELYFNRSSKGVGKCLVTGPHYERMIQSNFYVVQ